MNPSALRALCELADIDVRGKRALKLVLVSDRPLLPIIDPLLPINETSAMESISKRLTHDFHLRPMSVYPTISILVRTSPLQCFHSMWKAPIQEGISGQPVFPLSSPAC